LEKVDLFGSGCVSARHKGSARSVRINPPRTSSCRMVEDMTVRNLSPAPQRYVHAVAKFGRFFGRSLNKLWSQAVSG
jgi:hypothetical protein